ncbi:TPA: ATP-dependent RecD-like DNA helicase [Candidatus Dependentiae bacterium]|nr:MAG: Helicase, RecD/TraA family [candidate division TM6 bacterium GW2011_GWE2_31_21]KKP52542.1 MAG: Helicase, RecD/TraA family [candidate division TM6 bacterium GW2011_GWF2_33_332]HBS48448.1 ATP-dependent RecD-like DNA helicase [Candidatus Dependentiae bacterium]HBZ73297.1 ATP-dependent RecD-like DNA helicase [Candidatus Dependentiae bacterium]
MNEIVEIHGTIEKELFKSPESGFSIFIVKVNSKENITAKGILPAIHQGESVTLRGIWGFHPKFGRQFEVKECIAKLPSNVEGIKKYLSSGLIKGIGPKYAEKLVATFGERTLEVIDETPDELFRVDGIGEKRVSIIIEAWQSQKEISRVMVFLKEKDISTSFATKIYKTYGKESVEKILENPYRLAEDIWGVGFKISDQVALKLGFEKNSSMRIKSGILFCLSQATNDGHLYLEIDELKNQLFKMLELEESDESKSLVKAALNNLYLEEKIKLLTNNEKHYLSLPKYYYSEKGIANKIKKLKDYNAKNFYLDFNEIYKTVSATDSYGKQLNEDQQKGILSCLQSKITIITGGPGTGKTTLIKKLLEVLDNYKINYRLAAPTGRAAKRMFEGTGKSAETLHRLLEFNPTTMNFNRNEENALLLDFLIVDEASMIDVFLMNSILRAMPLQANLVLIGDVDQLPSVGAGNILNDLIASNQVEVLRLTQIFRQAEDSMIIVNAHRINHGEFPTSTRVGSKNDFKFIKEDLPENIFPLLRQIYANLENKYKISPQDSIVLCPMNRGVVGTQRLNQELQMILNPQNNEEKQVARFGQVYKINDRVMQIKNNYDKFVFNGDIGEITDINRTDQILKIKFGERVLDYDFTELDEIVLSYAVSIHKSQGSEFKAVIIPIFMQHFVMLQRNLIYTAITRAKNLCIFIGQPRAIAMGIKNNKSVIRNTFLKEFLTTDLEAR